MLPGRSCWIDHLIVLILPPVLTRRRIVTRRIALEVVVGEGVTRSLDVVFGIPLYWIATVSGVACSTWYGPVFLRRSFYLVSNVILYVAVIAQLGGGPRI